MIDFVSYGDESLLVHLKAGVLDAFCKNVQTGSRKLEACGVLVGSTSVDFKEVWVESISESLPKDRRGRAFFFLRDKGHQKFVDRMFGQSGGTKRLLGSWHTHPEKSPSPSSADYRGWNKLIKRNPDFAPLIFVIVGTCEINLFIKRGRKFVKLSPISNHEKIPRC